MHVVESFVRWSFRFRFLPPVLPIVLVLGVSTALALAAPTLPTINPTNIVNITNFGAVSSTTLTNTAAIQSAINFASATNGGATVEIPAGTYLSGPLTMQSKVNLQIDTNAMLQMLPYAKWSGTTTFINGSGLSDIEISGYGTIDGQGADWWTAYNASKIARPNFINFSGCTRILIQNVTLQNAPTFHLMLKGNNVDLTIRDIIVNTPGTSPNTDGMDLGSTNVLVQHCTISTGDDNIQIGGSSALAANILVTDCTFRNGHGVSIGGYTQAGISNLTVINCTFSGTDNGIRIKADMDRGGMVQNLKYLDLGMTNVQFPILIYSYYTNIGTPRSISPYYASTQVVATVTNTTPLYRNIIFSNINATSVSGYPVGMIWARTELPATNIIFNRVNVTGDRNFCLYNVSGAQFIDSKINVSANSNTFALFNAQVIVTNSAPTNTLFTFDGLTTNGYGNSLAFYNARASLKNTNAFDNGPLTIADSILTISNNFMLFPSTVLNFTLDPNTNRVAVVGNLALGGTINVTNGPGFGEGTNTLLTYTGTLSGNLPTLGSTPGGAYTYTFNTNTAGQVRLIVALSAPPAPTNFTAAATNLLIRLNWNAVSGATGYNLKRGTTGGGPYPTAYSGLTVTNYADAAVTNAVTYYYVVTAVAGSESTNSLPVSAMPLPSAIPTNIVAQVSSGELQLLWPQDHQGWRLQIQTNTPGAGLGNNWVTVPNSTNVYQISIPIDPDNGSVFLRLAYP
jgi:polygalacturonase